MKIKKLCSICFEESELREALLGYFEATANNLVCGSPEYEKRMRLIRHFETNGCDMEWVDGEFVLSADNYAEIEDV